MKEIWPENDGDNIIQVEDSTYDMIKEAVWKFTNPDSLWKFTNGDSLWEFARRAFECERKAKARSERHARGDFKSELVNLEGYVTDVSNRLDNTPYRIAQDMLTKVYDCQETSRGFDKHDAKRLQELYDKLTDEVHKTDEMVVTIGGLVKELSEAVK